MDLKRAIKLLDPDTVVYLGSNQQSIGKKNKSDKGSGFFYIGFAKDAPVEEYGDIKITDVYDREVDYHGKIILLDTKVKMSCWFWHEYDSSVPTVETPYTQDTEPYENILIQVVKNDISDYRLLLSKEIKKKKPCTMEGVDLLIKRIRKKSGKLLEFESGTNIGEYLISAVEDEIRTYWLHPNLKKMTDYDKRAKIIKDERRRLQTERVKQNAPSRYATIKGRSVYHE
jgi:hypothetical protein